MLYDQPAELLPFQVLRNTLFDCISYWMELVNKHENVTVGPSDKNRTGKKSFLSPRFSIKALLLLTTILAVVIAYYLHLSQIRDAVVAVEAIGGKVGYFEKDPNAIGWLEAKLRQRLPRCYFDDVKRVESDPERGPIRGFFNSKTADWGADGKSLHHLSVFTSLEELVLDSSTVNDEALKHLSGLDLSLIHI